jgi:hypothetical protein
MKDDKKQIGTAFKFMLEALKLIKDKKEDKGKIECPKCKGDLIYSRASSNGHVWGKCKTDNCLSWMQ